MIETNVRICSFARWFLSSEFGGMDLDEDVNKFLEDIGDIEVIDIKQSICINSVDPDFIPEPTVFVLYTVVYKDLTPKEE